MRSLDFGRYALCSCAAAAMLTACGGSQSSIEPPRAIQANGINFRIGHDQGSIAVGAYARSLLYVYVSDVAVYTYPRGEPLGLLGVGGDLCSDRFGNVVVAGTAGVSLVWVYAHGASKPFATMYNPNSPGGCSVDPSSENLAVAGAYPGSVVIWPYNPKRGWRLAHEYTVPNMRESLYSAYDPQGNLFIDGESTSGSFILAELPKGSSTFTTITLNRVIHKPGSMQWYGSYLVIEDAGKTYSDPAVIYRYVINGSSGHRVGVTTLTDSFPDAQFLIQGGTVIGPVSYKSGPGVGFWRFPSGGKPFRTLITYAMPSGEALSLK
jgi:hypothetical protein